MPHHDKTHNLMPRLSISQRALWVALATAAAPLAFFRLARRDSNARPLDLSIDNDDLYTDLFEGQAN